MLMPNSLSKTKLSSYDSMYTNKLPLPLDLWKLTGLFDNQDDEIYFYLAQKVSNFTLRVVTLRDVTFNPTVF